MDNVIAIIDSGICKELFPETTIIGGVTFVFNTSNSTIQCFENTYEDENGHGTVCAQAILRNNPNAFLYIVKILNKDNLAHAECLIKALEWLSNINIRFVNLSLAVSDPNCFGEIERAIEVLYLQGKFILAACNNCPEKRHFPAVLPHVYGVQGAHTANSHTYTFDVNAQIQCVGYDTKVPFFSLGWKVAAYGGTSLACAYLCGIASKCELESQHAVIPQIEQYLSKHAQTKDTFFVPEVKEGIDPNRRLQYDSRFLNEIISIWTKRYHPRNNQLLFSERLYSSITDFHLCTFGDCAMDICQHFLIDPIQFVQTFRIECLNSVYDLADLILALSNGSESL